MNLKTNLINKILLKLLLFSNLFSDGLWVKHGFEVFEYINEAPSVALG